MLIMRSVVTNLGLYKATKSNGLSTQYIKASPYMARFMTVLLNKCIDGYNYNYNYKLKELYNVQEWILWRGGELRGL